MPKVNNNKSNNAAVTTKLQEIEIGYLLLNEKADQYFNACYAFRASLALLKLSTLMQELTAEGLTGSYLVFFTPTSRTSPILMSQMMISQLTALLPIYQFNLWSRRVQSLPLTINSQIPISHYSDTIFDIIILSSAPKDDSIRGILLSALSHQQARNYDKQYPQIKNPFSSCSLHQYKRFIGKFKAQFVGIGFNFISCI